MKGAGLEGEPGCLELDGQGSLFEENSQVLLPCTGRSITLSLPAHIPSLRETFIGCLCHCLGGNVFRCVCGVLEMFS